MARGRGGGGRRPLPAAREASVREAKFKVNDPTLPILNYGARPIEKKVGLLNFFNYLESIVL